MNLLNKLSTPSYDYPSEVAKIVFCDFDETYLPYSDENKSKSGIRELEDFIQENRQKLSLIIGWVTGSSLDAALRKSSGYISRVPHFIASSLATELYWVEGNEIYESDVWEERINDSGFSKENIKKVVDSLRNQGVELSDESPDYQGRFMECYYYRITEKEQEDLSLIRDTAATFNVKAVVTKCNPATGDPADCYDVQFIPVCCGKEQILLFISRQFAVRKENTWAFGDSFNDLELLKEAGNGFLVNNADPETKKVFPSVLDKDYCYGIKDQLSGLIND